MSVVYLAINEKANKTWAVKELRKDKRFETGFARERLIAETELLKKLHHPFLPGIADVIEREDNLLIVMDYVEGRSLETLLQEQGALEQEEVVSLGKQLCQVLEYLHRQNPPVIYRDMKKTGIRAVKRFRRRWSITVRWIRSIAEREGGNGECF